jgi:hypothetical protein
LQLTPLLERGGLRATLVQSEPLNVLHC